MADDLVDLIDHYSAGDADGGVVLVGHSAGGPIIRLAASRRPEAVRGLVLVDPTDEGAPVFFGRTFRIGEKVALRAMLGLAKVGLLERPFRAALDTAPADDVRRDLEAEAFVPGVVRTQIAQSRTFLDELVAWRDLPPALPGVPVIVISGALAGNGMSRSLREQSNDSHVRRAALAPRGRHVLAPNSGHMVPLTDADLIVEEIRRLVQPGS